MLLVLAALTLLFPARPVMGADVLVVQSLAIKPYEKALQGLRSVAAGSLERIYCTKMDRGEVERYVRRRRPDLIYAIGMDALNKLGAVHDIPIVYLMVLNPLSADAAGENVTGVSLVIEPSRQLSLMRQVLPQLKRVGILYDPGKSAALVERARAAASRSGVELVARPVASPRDVIAAINGIAGKVNAFWLIPDTTVVSSVTLDLLLLASIEHKIPVFAFSEKYVERGALLSLEIDEFDLGRQAGEMGNRILAGARVRSVRREDARGGTITINQIVAHKMGIRIGEELLRRARVIRQGN